MDSIGSPVLRGCHKITWMGALAQALRQCSAQLAAVEKQSGTHRFVTWNHQNTDMLYYIHFSQIVGPGCERDLQRELRRMG